VLKHVVFMKFKTDTSAEQIGEVEERLGALPDVIDEIRGFVFGQDVVKSERSCDFALVSDFDDLDAMKRYQVHPRHQEVVALLRNICQDIKAVDFEY